MENLYRLWKPIEFTENWKACDTSVLDDISSSWFERRKKLREDSGEYADFLNRLKREHAIETGIIERLYDLRRGITETFINDGFIRSALSHGDTNIATDDLMNHLNDHLDSVNFVFDVVKENRPLSTSFIKALHQLITRNQKYAEGRDQFGYNFETDLQRLNSLLAGLKSTDETIPLSSEAIVTLIHQHLECPNSSRLPVLIVAAAYKRNGALRFANTPCLADN